MIKITKSFIIATAILVLGSITAATSYWFAHVEGDMRFTLLGFAAAIFSGMYYGLSVETNTIKGKSIPQPN